MSTRNLRKYCYYMEWNSFVAGSKENRLSTRWRRIHGSWHNPGSFLPFFAWFRYNFVDVNQQTIFRAQNYVGLSNMHDVCFKEHQAGTKMPQRKGEEYDTCTYFTCLIGRWCPFRIWPCFWKNLARNSTVFCLSMSALKLSPLKVLMWSRSRY